MRNSQLNFDFAYAGSRPSMSHRNSRSCRPFKALPTSWRPRGRLLFVLKSIGWGRICWNRPAFLEYLKIARHFTQNVFSCEVWNNFCWICCMWDAAFPPKYRVWPEGSAMNHVPRQRWPPRLRPKALSQGRPHEPSPAPAALGRQRRIRRCVFVKLYLLETQTWELNILSNFLLLYSLLAIKR